MTRSYSFFTLIVCIGILTGCSSEEILSQQDSTSNVNHPWLRGENEVMAIAMDGANYLFSNPNNDGSHSRNVESRTISEIIPISDKFKSRSTNASPLMYAVNFDDEQGYAIVSAYKSMPPLIGIVETGHYTPTENDNISFNYYLSLLQDSDHWELDTNAIKFEPAIKERTLRDTVGFVTVEPRVKVRWGQNDIEGAYCPNLTSGCSNTALAMAMSYFEWPKSLYLSFLEPDYENITLEWDMLKHHAPIPAWFETCHKYDYPIHDNLGKLMRELGYRSNTTYNGDGQSPTKADMTILCASGLGYTTYRKEFANNSALNYMNDGIFLMYGNDSARRSAHMWVCDGYIKYTIVETYQRYQGFPQKWTTIATDSKTYLYNHFNWGWNGTDNGYFIDMDFRNYNDKVYFIRLTL